MGHVVMGRISWIAGIFLLCLTQVVSAEEGEMTGREIMIQQRQLQQSKTEFEMQKMTLTDKDGGTEVREVRFYSKEFEPSVYRTLIVFMKPDDVKGTALLMWEHQDAPNDQWLYLPAQGTMQQVLGGGKKTYFMGTDFTYSDFEIEDPDKFSYNVLTEEIFDGNECYVVEAAPATEQERQETSYSKRVLWITKEYLTPLKVKFYDRRGELVKIQVNSDWEQVTDTIWRPRRAVMNNLKTRHKTSVETIQRAVDQNIPDDTFTERFILEGRHIQ